jgi:uncharacterized membrane protein HdeD (DUF308 family)
MEIADSELCRSILPAPLDRRTEDGHEAPIGDFSRSGVAFWPQGGHDGRTLAADVVRHASTWSIVWGILLIVFGVLAIGSPFLAAVAVNAVIAWLIILAGVVHLVLAFHGHRAGSMIWKLLVGWHFFGIYLLMHPVLGVASLSLVLALLFLIEGILDIVLFFQMRSMRGSGWVLGDGIITLLLGLLIYP